MAIDGGVTGELRRHKPCHCSCGRVDAENDQRDRRKSEIDRDKMPHSCKYAGLQLVNNDRLDRSIERADARGSVTRCAE